MYYGIFCVIVAIFAVYLLIDLKIKITPYWNGKAYPRRCYFFIFQLAFLAFFLSFFIPLLIRLFVGFFGLSFCRFFWIARFQVCGCLCDKFCHFAAPLTLGTVVFRLFLQTFFSQSVGLSLALPDDVFPDFFCWFYLVVW